MQSFAKIAAVVVTHNRLVLLKECLASVRAQNRLPEVIIVVDNGSTDGTAEYLKCETGLTVVTQSNQGGAGGFFTGMKAAYEWGSDAIWCMDDDTIPYPETLSGLLHTADAYAAMERTKPLGWVGSVDCWTDGNMHVMNRPKLVSGCDWLVDCPSLMAVPAIFSSYVSILFTRDSLRVAGYPLREMFIWGDDVEHTMRVTGAGFEGLVSFASRCLHKTVSNKSSTLDNISNDNLWKYRWHFRNGAYIEMNRWYWSKGKRVGAVIENFYMTIRKLVILRRFDLVWFFLTNYSAGLFVRRTVIKPLSK